MGDIIVNYVRDYYYQYSINSAIPEKPVSDDTFLNHSQEEVNSILWKLIIKHFNPERFFIKLWNRHECQYYPDCLRAINKVTQNDFQKCINCIMIGKDLLYELKEDDVNGNLENIISDYCWDNLYTDIMELIKIEFHKWCEQNPSSPYLFTFLPVDNAHELANREDDIGDKILVNQKIDYDTRDKAWIDLNGKIYMSDRGETHIKIINRILKERNQQKLKGDLKRPNNDTLEAILRPDDYLAFGHLYGDIYIIDNCLFEAQLERKANHGQK